MVLKNIKRGLGGTADFLTFNQYDFDGLGKGNNKDFIGTNPENTETKKTTNNTQTNNNRSNQKRTANKKNGGAPQKMFYPVARGMNNITGDSLLIKCLEYIPPKTGITGDPVVFKATSAGKDKFGNNYEVGELQKDKEGKVVKDLRNRKLNNQGASQTTQNSKILYYVELPIPQDVNDSNTVTWGDDTMNIFMLAGLSIAQGAFEPGTFQEKKNKLINTLITGKDAIADADPSIRRAIVAAGTGAAIDVLGGNVRPNSLLGRSEGKILNSNLELLFDGVNLRSFPFSINFSPRNSGEGIMVKNIIRSFKKSMAAKKSPAEGKPAPGGQGGIFLRAPDVFSLEYKRDGVKHPFLNSFKNCALTGMSVNYTNAGTYTTYEDGTPVSINMNLTFKELNPIYAEDYDELEAGVGF